MNNNRHNRIISLLLMAVVVTTMAMVACNSEDPEDVIFDLSIEGGALTLDPPVMKVSQGDTVTFNVASDEPGSVHLHGHDEEFEVGPDVETTVVFEADATGSFKLTFHAGEHDPEEHGAIFDSLWLAEGESFSFDFSDELEGMVIPFHNHMDHEISGTITVEPVAAPLAVVAIEVREGSFLPSDVSVGLGTRVIWTNVGDVQARVVSGMIPAPGEEPTDEHDEGEEEEVQLGSLEVHPR